MYFFIRHNQLAKPFDDYNNLNFEDLIKLSNQEISPNISNNYQETEILSLIKNKKIDQVYVSPQLRTQQTANLIWFDNFEMILELNEINFEVETLITKKEYLKWGLQIIRDRFWQHLFEGEKGMEKLEKLWLKIDLLKNILKENKNKNKNILFISHGFLLTFLKQILLNKKEINIENYQEIKFEAITYLDGFSLKTF